MPHVDVLHPGAAVLEDGEASRGRAQAIRVGRSRVARCRRSSARLSARGGRATCPGFEIPARYFQFVRSGDAGAARGGPRAQPPRPADARGAHRAAAGPGAQRPGRDGDAREALALGHVYARGRARTSGRARASGERSSAAARRAAPTIRSGSTPCVRWRSRAAARGGTKRRPRAGVSWRRCAAVRRRSCAKPPRRSRSITSTACAIYALARRFALGSLAATRDGPRRVACAGRQHRLARLERKIGESARNGLLLDVGIAASRRLPGDGCADSARSAYRAAGAASFLVFAPRFLRLSDVCAPYFFVNRSTRPSVSSSFCLPVKNGWQLEQISRCSSGLVERVFHVAPHAQRASTSRYFG